MTVTGPIRRSDLKRQYDREQWSAPVHKAWESVMVGTGGEFLTREVSFGRGFESPPILNWDTTIISDWPMPPTIQEISLMTVGVAYWIRDEREVVTGARIWIKIPCPAGSCCQ